MLRVTGEIILDESELEESFIRASGPGGQNVNRVASAVQLRFNVARSPSLPAAVRQRLYLLAANRINEAGELVIVARRHRTQGRNRQDARQRLVALIRAAAVEPARRQPTRPSRAARERRLQDKRQRSQKKEGRRKGGWGDEG